MHRNLNRLLRQQVEERVEIDQVRKDLIALAAKCTARMNMPAAPMPAAVAPQPVAAATAKRPTVIKKA